jgi:hypothetical protein
MSTWPETKAKGQERRRRVLDDRVLDAVEIGQARLPVIRVLRDLDALVRLELDELERAGADRVLPHLCRRHVARVDRREAVGNQVEECRLRPLQMKGDLVIAVGGKAIEVLEAGLSRVDPELVAAAAPGRQVA